MISETPKTSPILEIAWMRYAQLDASSMRRTTAHKRLRFLIAGLSVLATLLSIIVGNYYRNDETSLGGFTFKILFIATPIVASLLAAFGSRTFANSDWLITRAAAEEYLKEIYFFRTVLRGIFSVVWEASLRSDLLKGRSRPTTGRNMEMTRASTT